MMMTGLHMAPQFVYLHGGVKGRERDRKTSAQPTGSSYLRWQHMAGFSPVSILFGLFTMI
jgi:hypothetical protein